MSAADKTDKFRQPFKRDHVRLDKFSSPKVKTVWKVTQVKSDQRRSAVRDKTKHRVRT